jgi:predicted nucleotide-binding protein
MARARLPEPDPPVTGPQRALNINRLREGLAAIPKWKEVRDARSTEFQTWQSRTHQSLGAVFGKVSDYYKKFGWLVFWVPRIVMGGGGREWSPMDDEAFDRDIVKAEAILKDALEEIDATEGVSTSAAQPTPIMEGSDVFIVHGHDETNLHRLRDLIEKKFKLHPVIMKWEAGKGRVMIEKFEQEAARCRYAFALLTPDDQIVATDGEYTQARPNVVFELGWFYGRLGRSNVVILLKKGTKLHSDLDGISQITFGESVEEKYLDIERELQAAGLLSS